MAESSSPLDQAFSWPTLLLLAAAAGWTAWFAPTLFKPYGSANSDAKFSGAAGDQTVPARLWQDPFTAVAAEVEQKRADWKKEQDEARKYPLSFAPPPPKTQGLADLREDILQHYHDGGNNTLLILPVMVEGGTYADNVENRLRDRVAVLDALASNYWKPEDGSDLGVVWSAWPEDLDLLQKENELTAGNRAGETLDNLWKQTLALDETGNEDNSRELVLPYEWMDQTNISQVSLGTLSAGNGVTPPKQKLLVLWLNEDEFSDHPLTRLALLLNRLNLNLFPASTLEANQSAAEGSISVHAKLLGPRTSDCLENMLKEVRGGMKAAPDWVLDPLCGLEIYSSQATIADSFLLVPTSITHTEYNLGMGSPNRFVPRAEEVDRFKASGITFNNLTCTDEQLVEALLYALHERGVFESSMNGPSLLRRLQGLGIRIRRKILGPETPQPPTIVLLSDWDTAYGRTLPVTFRSKLRQWQSGKIFSQLARHAGGNQPVLPPLLPLLTFEDVRRGWDDAYTNNDSWGNATIYQYNYLLGLDGTTAAVSEATSDASNSAKATSSTGGNDHNNAHTGSIEEPEGTQQLDYLRRAAETLGVTLQAADPLKNNDPDAIGVLGYNVYDKLRIIEIFHKTFPGSLIFTTDMDARLLDPSQEKWARNVVVASSFGLELKPGLQAGYAPFRDSYQTALFVAARCALGLPFLVKDNHVPAPQPQLFEIGRTQAVPLNYSLGPASPYASTAVARQPLLFLLSRGNACILVLLLVLPVLLVLFFFPLTFPIRVMLIRGAFLIAILAIPMVIWRHYYVRTGMEEPLGLTEGASLWPSEFIRMVALLFALGATLDFLDRLTKESRMADDFCLGGGAPLKPGFRKWIRMFLKRDIIVPIAAVWISLKMPGSKRMHAKFGKDIADEQFETHQGFGLAQTPVLAIDCWQKYRRDGAVIWRLIRSISAALSFMGVFAVICLVTGLPKTPNWGDFSKICDTLILFFSVLVVTFLNFLVADATRLLRRFIRDLSKGPTDWPPELLDKLHRQTNVPWGQLDGWVDVNFIGELTERLGSSIYYPFICLLLMVLARSTLFDQWTWPPSLVILFIFAFSLAIFSSIGVQQAAARARTDVLERLDREVLRTLSAGTKDQVEELIQQIKDYHRGAFLPLMQQPWVRSLLIPLGGTGLLQLLQYYSSH